jgi:hypothetical protein
MTMTLAPDRLVGEARGRPRVLIAGAGVAALETPLGSDSRGVITFRGKRDAPRYRMLLRP